MSSFRVDVTPGDKKGQFKVLVNFIQRGPIYTSKEVANSEAEKLRSQGF